MDGNYTPCNCRWATPKTQANNSTKNVYVDYKNRRQTLKQWADELGLNYKTIHTRLRSKWSVEKAFETPIRRW